jgi:hypothetical protein
MKLVSEHSEDELKKRAAAEEFERALNSMATNMLRVIAGAGEPQNISLHALRCALAAEDYHEAHHEYPSASRVAELLEYSRHDATQRSSWSDEDRERWVADGTYDQMLATAQIRQASLRVVAAQLAKQRTILANAEHLFSDAIRNYLEARERCKKAALGALAKRKNANKLIQKKL